MTQARLDALADAETLRLYLRSLPLGSLLRPGMPALGLVDGWGVRKAILRQHQHVAARRARSVARAAFCAIPTLRSES